VLRSSCL